MSDKEILSSEEHQEPSPAIEWDKMPYPEWLRAWLDDVSEEIRKSGEAATYAEVKTKAKARIEQDIEATGIPPQYQNVAHVPGLIVRGMMSDGPGDFKTGAPQEPETKVE